MSGASQAYTQHAEGIFEGHEFAICATETSWRKFPGPQGLIREAEDLVGGLWQAETRDSLRAGGIKPHIEKTSDVGPY